MNILAFIFIFVLGTIIGSFLNVVIYRFNSGVSVSKGRSMCMSCGKNLRYYELIPLFSFLLQKGKCRSCTSKISYQYPLVEFSTALLFVLTAFYFTEVLEVSRIAYVGFLSLYTFIFSLLVVICVYDIRHKIIPNTFVYLLSLLALLSAFITTPESIIQGQSFFTIPTIFQLLAGPLLALPFAFLWLVSRGKWIGFGDAKLMLAFGWLLGLAQGFASMILAFWIGAVVGIVLLIVKRKKVHMKTEVPFAPFLILGALISFFFSIDIFSLSQIFIF